MEQPSTLMRKVRAGAPLVHHITNYVTVNDCANACICAGGSPVMTDEAADVKDMTPAADAVVLNIGTLSARTVESMELAAGIARSKGIPFVLDPVGAGATGYRTEVAGRLLEAGPAVVKGNAGEIGFLSGTGGEVKGVDSAGADDAAGAAEALARRLGCVVVATGKVDRVSDGRTTVELSNGHPLLGRVSGTGCMLSSVVGCYAGACGANVESVCAAVTAFNVAAEIAATRCGGPGTFKPALLDALENLDPAELDSRARIRTVGAS